MKKLLLLLSVILCAAVAIGGVSVPDFNPKFGSIRVDSTGSVPVRIRAAGGDTLHLLFVADSTDCGELFWYADTLCYTPCDAGDTIRIGRTVSGSPDSFMVDLTNSWTADSTWIGLGDTLHIDTTGSGSGTVDSTFAISPLTVVHTSSPRHDTIKLPTTANVTVASLTASDSLKSTVVRTDSVVGSARQAVLGGWRQDGDAQFKFDTTTMRWYGSDTAGTYHYFWRSIIADTGAGYTTFTDTLLILKEGTNITMDRTADTLVLNATGAGGTSDSIGYDTGAGTFTRYLYPAFLREGTNVTFSGAGDTLTISAPGGSGTSDSIGYDTGAGTFTRFLYPAYLREGTGMTFSGAGDTLSISTSITQATSDSIRYDTGAGTFTRALYPAFLREGTNVTFSGAGDTLTISATGGGDTTSKVLYNPGTIADSLKILGDTLTFDTDNDTSWFASPDVLIIEADKIGSGTTVLSIFAESLYTTKPVYKAANHADSQLVTKGYAQTLSGSGTADSVGVDTGAGTFTRWLYPAYIREGSNVTMSITGDTLSISSAGGGGTSDSIGYDTGAGTFTRFLYPAYLREGTGLTFSGAGDTLSISSSITQATNDSIRYDTGAGTFTRALYPAFLRKGTGITLSGSDDTLTISSSITQTTSDSIGYDTGAGTFTRYLYPAFLREGANVTFSGAGDTLTISAPGGSGTSDSIGYDTGAGTFTRFLYPAYLREGTNVTLSGAGDTLTISATGNDTSTVLGNTGGYGSRRLAEWNSATLELSDDSGTTMLQLGPASGDSLTITAYSIILDGDTLTAPLQAHKLHEEVKNTTGSAIAKGVPVYIIGQVGDLPRIATADAASATTMPAIGLTETAINNGDSGYVATFGTLAGLNTSAYDSGAAVYVANGGGLTATKPTGTNLIQKVGVVSRVHASQGHILISGAGRTNDIPNIASDNVWVGNASGVPTATGLNAYIDTTSAKIPTASLADSAIAVRPNVLDSLNIKDGSLRTEDILDSTIQGADILSQTIGPRLLDDGLTGGLAQGDVVVFGTSAVDFDWQRPSGTDSLMRKSSVQAWIGDSLVEYLDSAAVANRYVKRSGGLSGLSWRYVDSSITDGDPGARLIRFNNAFTTVADSAFIDRMNVFNYPQDSVMIKMKKGDYLRFSTPNNERQANYSVTGAVVNGSGYWKLPILFIDGVDFTDEDTLRMEYWFAYDSAGTGSGGIDSIGVDADGGAMDAWYKAGFGLREGANITFTMDGDTLTIAGAAGSGTADSIAVDTAGTGSNMAYLYSSSGPIARFKEGSGITMTVDTDTLTIAASGSGGDTAVWLGNTNSAPEDTVTWKGDSLHINSANDTTWVQSADVLIGDFDKIGGGTTVLSLYADSIVAAKEVFLNNKAADSAYATKRYARDAAGDSVATALRLAGGAMTAGADITAVDSLDARVVFTDTVISPTIRGDVNMTVDAGATQTLSVDSILLGGRLVGPSDSTFAKVADGSITGGTAGSGVKIAANTITTANINGESGTGVVATTVDASFGVILDIDSVGIDTLIVGTRLRPPTATTTAPTVEGSLIWDTGDDWLATNDGSNQAVLANTKRTCQITIDDPDNLVGDTVMMLTVDSTWAPAGITITAMGIKTWASSSYSVVFAEYTAPGNGNRVGAIETVATSTSTEARDDAPAAGVVEGGNIVCAEMPATDVQTVTLWFTFRINDN